MDISIIIPTLNEENSLQTLLPYLKEAGQGYTTEIIVADGGSKDKTKKIALTHEVQWVQSQKASRAVQMNLGAKKANGKILYFVHADCLPPSTFATDITQALAEGFHFGRYQSCYNTPHPFLKLNAYFTRYNWRICRGGDQTLFVCRTVFNKLNGFSEEHLLMEEYDLLDRAEKEYKLKIFPKACLISARKYDNNSYFRVNLANLLVYKLYKLDLPQEKLLRLYRHLLK